MQFEKINNIIKTAPSKLIFEQDELQWLEERISLENETAFTTCIIREKKVKLTPEEVIRQLYTNRLIEKYKYPQNLINFEVNISFGREKKRADIIVHNETKEGNKREYIIVETKQAPEKEEAENTKKNENEGKEQLRSYTNATGAPIAILVNGKQEIFYNRIDPNLFFPIQAIPDYKQKLSEVIKQERFTLKQLILKDEILENKKDLQEIIKDLENDVLANAGVDVFEEVFKLLFTKLYDESLSREDKSFISKSVGQTNSYEEYLEEVEKVEDKTFRSLEFRNKGNEAEDLKEEIEKLFNNAKRKWDGIFSENDKILLKPSHLQVCVAYLEKVKLFNSNLDVIDKAFEYLINKSSKGEKGQYFTPRHVIDMCVKMLNPQKGEYIIDTASGSCGFPVHSIFHFIGRLYNNQDISTEDKEYVEKVFGIDFDERAVRVGRTLNLIAGDGNTNVLHLNTLDYNRWHEELKNTSWNAIYSKGYNRMQKLKAEGDNKKFNFDVLMANPPFAGDIKESRILSQYELSGDKNKISREVLFIERNLDFVKKGGRLAIVLPQGIFNNSTAQYIREFFSEKARILGVVSLAVNTFKPHTGTKTSVLFLQKWDDTLCPKKDDYNIFFAVSEKSGKDNSGKYEYIKDVDDNTKIDLQGHKIVNHDLYKLTPEQKENGIAEEFIEFCKQEGLSFH